MEYPKQGSFDLLEFPSITDKEKSRWSKHVSIMHSIMQDQEWHNKQELVEATGTGNFQARVHDLRKAGFKVECVRAGEGGATLYKIESYVGYDTTTRKHCDCCRYNDEFIASYTG